MAVFFLGGKIKSREETVFFFKDIPDSQQWFKCG